MAAASLLLKGSHILYSDLPIFRSFFVVYPESWGVVLGGYAGFELVDSGKYLFHSVFYSFI